MLETVKFILEQKINTIIPTMSKLPSNNMAIFKSINH